MLRLSGLAAMLGGIIGLINISLLALAYFATADGAEFAHAPVVSIWVAVAQPLLKPLLSFATADEVYLTYGKVMLLVFLGIGTLRAGIAPRLAGWLLLLVGAPGMLVTLWLVGHNSGGLFVLYLAWLVIGYWLWATDQPMRNRNEGECKS